MLKVVITGGSGGLGKAITERLKGEFLITDFSRTSGVDLTKGIPDFECDILILNAGVWKNDWRLNYEVPKEMAEVAPKNPLVIFILSNAAYRSYGNDDYTAAKSGLLRYANRKQMEGYNFTTISPGTIDTGFWDGAEVDNRKKGCMKPEVVAELVYQAIKAWQNGALITELVVLPRK